MKVRNRLVSNSSSTSFFITNLTDQKLTLEDFVEENPQILNEFLEEYPWHQNEPKFNQRQMMADAKAAFENFPPGCSLHTYRDEDETVLGCVFDYALRKGRRSKRFRWELYKCRGQER